MQNNKEANKKLIARQGGEGAISEPDLVQLKW